MGHMAYMGYLDPRTQSMWQAINRLFVCVVAHHVMLCVMQWLLLLVVGTLFLCTGYYMEFSCEIFLFFFHFTYSRVGKIKLKFILIN